MTFQQLVLELCKREGKKKQVNVAQMSEVLARLGEILIEEGTDAGLIVGSLVHAGAQKAKKNVQGTMMVIALSVQDAIPGANLSTGAPKAPAVKKKGPRK